MSLVVVSGAIANKLGNGGSVWSRLSYTLGLQRLGYQVYFVEQLDPHRCIAADGTRASWEKCANRAWFRQITRQFGLEESAALIYGNGAAVDGLNGNELTDLAGAADALINISGHLRLDYLLKCFRHKIYVDQDPGYTQFWHADGNTGAHLGGHDAYFTVGENIGTPECSIPTGGIRWRPARPPVVLAHWPVSYEGDCRRFTTIASWRGAFGPVDHSDRRYGLKAHEFRKYLEIPRLSPYSFEIALSIDSGDREDFDRLRKHNWKITDPKSVAPDPEAFRRYIQTSGAEFSAAQGIYVDTGSGWFSDRTTRYLASGKPALVQETGFSRQIPSGEGLISFRTLKEAVEGAERIVRDYDRHCQAARHLAEDYFDSDKVLGRMMEEAGVMP
jgi:hypothetical protein